jgi:hypothetical protein
MSLPVVMFGMTECVKCGLDEKHSGEECEAQQAKNLTNRLTTQYCNWCGSSTKLHRDGCPKHKSDKCTSRKEGRTTTIEIECGYCQAKTVHTSEDPDKHGYGGASYGGANHEFHCPKHIHVRM